MSAIELKSNELTNVSSIGSVGRLSSCQKVVLANRPILRVFRRIVIDPELAPSLA
jgi:hypothetical protein